MPPGLTDLLAVVKLARKIKVVGSGKYTNAQQEFTEFLADVNTLRTTFEAIEQAARLTGPNDNPLDLSSEFVQSFITEANETLASCKKLIDQNPHFKKDKEGYITNILWALTVAEHVQKQQTRIQICTQKANFVVQQRGIAIIQGNQELAQGDSRADHEETHRLLRGLYGTQGSVLGNWPDATNLLSASILVVDRFEKSLSAIAPNERPSIAQRFDAVVTFCDRSTNSFEPQEPLILSPSPIQYLNLLKCIWLLQHIQADPAFVGYYEQPFSAAWTRNVARRVHKQAIRFLHGTNGIRPVDQDDLLRLSEADFQVDPRQTHSDPTPGPLEANGGEVLLMRKTLKSTNQNNVEEILLFRIAEARLRLTKALSSQGQALRAERTITSGELNCRKVCLNPIYALGPTANITWKASSTDQTGQELALATVMDAIRIQEFVTNFKVACDEQGLLNVRKKAGTIDSVKVIGEMGRAQIWMYKDPFSSKVQSPGSSNDLQSDQTSRRTSTGRSSGTWTQSALTSLNPSSTIRSGDGGAFLDEPIRPQIVLLSELAGTKRLISISIDEYTQIAPDKCHCSDKNIQCKEIFVERRGKKTKIRSLQTKAYSDGWNVAVLGEPRHEEAGKLDEENVKWVSITFTSAEIRENFEKKLNIACASIRNRVDAHHKDLRLNRDVHLAMMD